MAKILIVEPHGDDGFISCASVLHLPNHEKTLLTISDRPSTFLEGVFPNVKTLYMDHRNINYFDRIKFSTHLIENQFNSGVNVYGYMRSETYKKFKEEFESISQELMERIDRSLIDQADYVLIPLGIDHPYHILVSWTMEKILTEMGRSRVLYVEKPYSDKRFVRRAVQSYLKIRPYETLVPTEYPEDLKELKSKTFLQAYPTENPLVMHGSDTIYFKGDEFIADKTSTFFDKVLKDAYEFTSIKEVSP